MRHAAGHFARRRLPSGRMKAACKAAAAPKLPKAFVEPAPQRTSEETLLGVKRSSDPSQGGTAIADGCGTRHAVQLKIKSRGTASLPHAALILPSGLYIEMYMVK